MNRPAIRTRLRHLPSGLVASLVLLCCGVPLGALVGGGPAAIGAAAGVALVAASYTVSSLVVAWADAVDPRLVLPVGLAAYAVKFILLGVVMAAVAATGWSGLPAMGIAIIASALGWITAQSWWTWHARIPYVQIDP